MEEVAHRVHEDHPRARPLQRLLQPLRPQLQLKPLLVRMPWDAAPALGERLCIAMSAARRDLVATRHWVPGRLCPLDCAVVGQGGYSFGFVGPSPATAIRFTRLRFLELPETGSNRGSLASAWSTMPVNISSGRTQVVSGSSTDLYTASSSFVSEWHATLSSSYLPPLKWRYRPGTGGAFASVGASRDGTKLMLPSQSDVASGERCRSRLSQRLMVSLRASARLRASRFSGMNTSSDIRPTSGRTEEGLADVGWSDMAVMLAPAPTSKVGSPPPMRRARARRRSPAAR
jgi:hypothetical protein